MSQTLEEKVVSFQEGDSTNTSYDPCERVMSVTVVYSRFADLSGTEMFHQQVKIVCIQS